MKRALVVGCGLSGAVIARELAEKEYEVLVLERRDHVGGNMYDYIDEYGVLVHKYGPHTFHTKKKELYDYMCKFGAWDSYKLTCGAVINGKCTPTPFNYQTIDDFYEPDEAKQLKSEIEKTFPKQSFATVVEALSSDNTMVQDYAQFLFDNDYSLYTAKQWGVSPSEIDPSVLRRVPLRFDYNNGYFEDDYQVMPHDSYAEFFNNLLNNKNIKIKLGEDALSELNIQGNQIYYKGEQVKYPVIFTGPIDELFGHRFGELPYRSLRFEWVHEDCESFQDMPVVAYPQEPEVVRIIEYKKLPIQDVKGTTYEKEYSLPYQSGERNEPYYPVLTEKSKALYQKYFDLAGQIDNLFVCGRLGNFKYYNMDEALETALKISEEILHLDIDC